MRDFGIYVKRQVNKSLSHCINMAVKLRKIRENMWEIKKEEKMKVPGLVFAFDVLMDRIKSDRLF